MRKKWKKRKKKRRRKKNNALAYVYTLCLNNCHCKKTRNSNISTANHWSQNSTPNTDFQTFACPQPLIAVAFIITASLLRFFWAKNHWKRIPGWFATPSSLKVDLCGGSASIPRFPRYCEYLCYNSFLISGRILWHFQMEYLHWS